MWSLFEWWHSWNSILLMYTRVMVAVVVLLSLTLAAVSAQDETGERLSQAWYLPPINNSMVIVTFCFCYCSMIATTRNWFILVITILLSLPSTPPLPRLRALVLVASILQHNLLNIPENHLRTITNNMEMLVFELGNSYSPQKKASTHLTEISTIIVSSKEYNYNIFYNLHFVYVYSTPVSCGVVYGGWR